MSAQFNVDRVIVSGKAALYYEDYVLSIQYFNQALNLKPYLWEPWHLRAIAKYNLEDYHGAEADATKAIELNPYIISLYDLRAVSRIRQEKFKEAITDYTTAISQDHTRKEFWYNRALCRVELKDYEQASLDADTIIQRWEKYTPTYLMKAQISLHQKDTLKAGEWLEKALSLDPYNADAWRLCGNIHLSQSEWKKADEALSKTLHLKPKQVDCYLNRAVARLKLNNLRGAMADYDLAIEFDPANFLGHYNRGLLRQQVGDDNRAIEDFNFVIEREPKNVMAILNRATLLEATGDLRGAIRDYTTVIDEFPNFWVGLQKRAACYRLLGMTAKAEQDEFRIFKAQMDKHLGIQQRWSKKKIMEVRKRSDIDLEKYNQIVVEDEVIPEEHQKEYKSEYRGRVQNRKVENSLQPYIIVSTTDYSNAINHHKPFTKAVDETNLRLPKIVCNGEKVQLYTSTMPQQLPESEAQKLFALIDTLTNRLSETRNPDDALPIVMARCAANTMTLNYHEAINDAHLYASIDSTSALPWWQSAVCAARLAEFESTSSASGNALSTTNNNLRIAGIIADFEKAHSLDPDNAYILYCRGTFHALRGDNEDALKYLSEAIALDSSFPEAYYNRGIVYQRIGEKQKAVADLSKAGELGIYDAYSRIKAK